jgi:hypothetical protein
VTDAGGRAGSSGDLSEAGRRVPLSRWIGVVLALSGYVVAVLLLGVWGAGRYPGDGLIWDRVGDEMRAGIDPYYASDRGFYYAPPIAVLLALVTWLPIWFQAAILLAANIGAIRYMAGSWRGLGWWLLFPIVDMELVGGQVNFLMGAAMLAAVRGVPWAAIVMAAAKVAPILAVDRRQWREVLIGGSLVCLVSLPALGLWPAWIHQLTSHFGVNIGGPDELQFPLIPRVAIALALVALDRPWSRMVAAIIALPTLYWPTLLLFLAVPWPRPRLVAPRWAGRLARRSS